MMHSKKLSDDEKGTRVKACFTCGVYCLINTSDYGSIKLLQRFEEKHRFHETQVVNLEEVLNFIKT